MSKKKKINIRKETRDEKARRELKKKIEAKEVAYGINLRLANKKNDYITNLVNGRYFLARCNMIAEQLLNKEIKESIDGALKTEEFLRAEYAHQKTQAIKSMRGAHFAKEDLKKDFNLTDDEIYDIEEDYYNGKIIREDYDESYKKRNKAEFVASSENKKG